MTHTFSKSAFYSFGDIPLPGPLPLIFSQLLRDYTLRRLSSTPVGRGILQRFRKTGQSKANAVDLAFAMEASTLSDRILFNGITQTLYQEVMAFVAIRIISHPHISQIDIA